MGRNPMPLWRPPLLTVTVWIGFWDKTRKPKIFTTKPYPTHCFFCFKDIEHDGLEKVCPCKSTASFGICNCWISMNFMGTNPDHGNVVIWIVVSTAAARKGNWLDTPHRSNMVTSFVAHFETHANTSVETHNFFKMRNLWQSSPLYLLYETLESINQHHRI